MIPQFRLSSIWLSPWTSVFGFIFGALAMLSSPSWMAPIAHWYDSWHPVAVPVSADVISRDTDSVVLHIVMDKKAGAECRPLRIYGYSTGADGVPGLAMVARPDGSTHTGVSHDAGLQDLGLWRVRPVEPTDTKAQVYVEHACVGRVTRSKIAEVQL